MRAYIAKCVLGVFAYDERGKLLASEDFPRDADNVAKLIAASESSLLKEEKKLIEKLKGYDIVIEKEGPVKGINVQNPNPAGKILRRDLENIASSAGISKKELRLFAHGVSSALARSKVKEASREKDRPIIQSTEALEDLDEALNLLSERMREWCSLHFSSMEKELDHRAYAEKLLAFDMEVGEAEEKALKSYSKQLLALYALRDELEDYIASVMEEIAPNLKALVGHTLGAKLISVGGGLSRLARMPASRIQVLGAEKAMFRHLRKKALPPKHGIIYQHPIIQKAPWWQRGKISRALAGKVAIACRVDALSGDYMGEELKEGFLRRVEEVKAAHPKAPRKGRR